MNILKNTYIIVGVIIFVFIFVMGIWLEFSWRDSLLAAAVLTAVGLVVEWVRQTFGWEP